MSSYTAAQYLGSASFGRKPPDAAAMKIKTEAMLKQARDTIAAAQAASASGTASVDQQALAQQQIDRQNAINAAQQQAAQAAADQLARDQASQEAANQQAARQQTSNQPQTPAKIPWVLIAGIAFFVIKIVIMKKVTSSKGVA
jgi:cobalamin biosynthesis Mg chelatase CobN